MSDKPKVYIAGMGMITPVGFDAASTLAAVRSGISGYQATDYFNKQDQPITMATVPDGAFSELKVDIDEGDRFNERHDKVIKMAIHSIRQACTHLNIDKIVPLAVAMPDVQEDVEGLSSYTENLEANCQPWVSTVHSRLICSGRAAGMEALNFAFRYLNEAQNDYLLIGGSDSYQDYLRLGPLLDIDRLLTQDNMDGFAPGEAACFILITPRPELAMVYKGHMIALNPPGIADEAGYLSSEIPYKGDGLDHAFKQALINHKKVNIHNIYSSMNGESHWAKEYGVAYVRNKTALPDKVSIIHPADILGDVGAATSPLLVALAAEHLYNHPKAQAHLVYSSSDGPKRGAVVVEKLKTVAN